MKNSLDAKKLEIPEIPPAKPEIAPSEWVRRMKKQKSKNFHSFQIHPHPHLPPKVHLMTKINSNDQFYIFYLNKLVFLLEYLSAVHEVAQNEPPPLIPKEYTDLVEVFSKKRAHELPPHCGPLDHHIHLKKDSKPIFGSICNLSETELQVLKVYIEKNLQRHSIRLSTSPFGTPVSLSKSLMTPYIYVLTTTLSTV